MRFLLGGITISQPVSMASSIISLLSYPRTANKKLSGNTVNQCYGLRAILCGTRCNSNSDRQPCAFTARCILLLSPLLCGPYPDYFPWFLPYGEDFAMTGIEHQPFKIWIGDQYFKKFFPYSLVSPTNKALVNSSPFAIFRRQISPRRAST